MEVLALFVAEQFPGRGFRIEAGYIDFDEWSITLGAGIVQIAGGDVYPATRFPVHQHPAVVLGDPAQLVAQTLHDGTPADRFVDVQAVAAQTLVLALQFFGLQSVFDSEQ